MASPRGSAFQKGLGTLSPRWANPRLAYDLGVLAESRQDDESAVRHFTASAKSPNARQKSYSALARIKQRQGQTADAADYGRRAAAPPDDAVMRELHARTEMLPLFV